jgi:hypothetical protein
MTNEPAATATLERSEIPDDVLEAAGDAAEAVHDREYHVHASECCYTGKYARAAAEVAYAAGRAAERAAIVDWLRECLHCGKPHQERPDPDHPGRVTLGDPGDGHHYEARFRMQFASRWQLVDAIERGEHLTSPSAPGGAS